MKRFCFAGLVLFAATAANADPRDDALLAMLRCSGTSDKAQRLACYDSAVVRVPGALNAPAPQVSTAPQAGAVPGPVAAPAPVRRVRRGFLSGIFGGTPSRAPQTTPAQFGIESIADGGRHAEPGPIDGDTLDQITARLVSYDVAGGFMTVNLDNGQSWRQISQEPVGTLRDAASRYVVTISRGTAGIYVMKISHFGRQLSVRRLR
ncbi:MAG: hypothetical protein H0U98_15050 [Alphaproteobacteria bacterium]|nr:hypothetical protein [Alphaproteobacteria bacterium]